MSFPRLDPSRFDAIANGPEKIWGLASIACAIGVSADTVKRLAETGAAPIYRPAGRYFALRSELNSWLRTPSTAANGVRVRAG